MSLAARAKFLRKERNFFHDRNITEVDTPMLHPGAPIDAYIDIMKIDSEELYLHSSPEYRMKELLAGGSGDIYQLSKVYRLGENGPWHTPEFTMIEYYRLGYTLKQLIDETLELINLFLPKKCVTRYTFQEALKLTDKKPPVHFSKQEGLHYIWATEVEPNMPKDHLTVVTPFPAEEAALSKIIGGKAQRFEIYYNGIELANGFDELQDATEQRKRLHKANTKRKAMGKPQLPIDEPFLSALKSGLPDCCGVAIGFDRLIKLNSLDRTSKEL